MPEHFERTIELFNTLKTYGQAFKKKNGKPGLGRASLAKALGLEKPFCRNFDTVYFADFSFMLFDMLESKKTSNPRGGFERNEEIIQLIKLPTDPKAATGLNVLIAMHWDATRFLTDRPADPKKETKQYKAKPGDPVQWAAGPSSPFGRMKQIVGYADFCVRLSVNTAGVRSVRVSGDSDKELLKLQFWDKVPEKFRGQTTIPLVNGVTLRTILQDYGYPIKDKPEIFSQGFIDARTEEHGPERFGQPKKEEKPC